MTTIPPTAAQALLSAAAAAQTPMVVVPQPPPELARLPPGSVIEVQVVAAAEARDAETAKADVSRPAVAVIVRTPAGDVPVRVSVPVQPGMRLALEVLRAGTNQVTAKVVAAESETMAADRVMRTALTETPVAKDAPAAQRPIPLAPTLPPGQAWTPGGAMSLTQVTPLSALVIAAPATGLFSIGAELAVRVITMQNPGTPAHGAIPGSPDRQGPIGPQLTPAISTPASGLASPGPTAPAVPGAYSLVAGGVASPVATTPSQALMPPGAGTAALPGPTGTSETAFRPMPQVPGTLIQPPAVAILDPVEMKLPGPRGLPSPAPTPPSIVQPAPPIALVAGQVVSLTSNGAPVVRTEVGDLQLNVRANLQVGAEVTIEITASTPPRPAAPVLALAAGPQALPLSPGNGWPSLTEALNLLQRIDPQAAAQLAATVPDGGPRTALAMMSFLHALRSGDPRAWPGDATLRALERAGPRGAHLAAQISGEVSELARRAGSDGGEWRSLPLPWNLDGKVDRISLVTRRQDTDEKEGKDRKRKGGGTRFVINLSLSRLGDMQLDGMFRKEARSFDLMIRTLRPVPEVLVRELPGQFAEVNAAMGLTGVLMFQVVRRLPDPTAAPGDPARPGLWA